MGRQRSAGRKASRAELGAGECLDVGDDDHVRSADSGHRRTVDVLEEVAPDRDESDCPPLRDRRVLRKLQTLHGRVDRDVEHLAVFDIEIGLDSYA